MLSRTRRRAPTRYDRDFHLIKEDYGENSIRNALARGTLIKDDAELIASFIVELRATRGISVGRANKITFALVRWRDFLGPYRTNTITDIHTGITRHTQAKLKGRPYRRNTLCDHVRFLKRFYRWLVADGVSSIPEKRIAQITAPRPDRMTKTASQLLTEEEIAAMIHAALNSRDRALIGVLYEGGFRIGELATLQWDQVKYDDYGCVINVDEKTGVPRYVRLVASAPLLAAWKNDYPLELNHEALVFVTEQLNPLQHAGVMKQIREIAARAGITKHVTLHLFRHSRITHLVQQGYNESVIKKMMWGRVDTMMLETYLHLCNQDVDNEILTRNGIKPREKMQSIAMAPRQCGHCYTVNAPTSNFCTTCGRPLTDEVKKSMEQIQREIEMTPEFQTVMGMLRERLEEGVVEG